MFVNARAIIERNSDEGKMILLQVRNKPYEGRKLLELPGGRVEEFESLVSALKREVNEGTGLEVNYIEGSNTRLETDSTDATVECLMPFAVYQTTRGPVDSMGVYFRCKAEGQLLLTGDETEEIRWVSVRQIQDWMKDDPEIFDWVVRAGILLYLKHIASNGGPG